MYVTLNEFVWATADRALSPLPPGGSRYVPSKDSRTISRLTKATPVDDPRRRPRTTTAGPSAEGGGDDEGPEPPIPPSLSLRAISVTISSVCPPPPSPLIPSFLQFLLVLLRVGSVLQVRARGPAVSVPWPLLLPPPLSVSG